MLKRIAGKMDKNERCQQRIAIYKTNLMHVLKLRNIKPEI